MQNTWVLLAHGTAGKILEIGNDKEILEEKNFSHPRTAKKDVKLALENPDTLVEGIKNMPVTPAVDYSGNMEHHEREVFAKEIADYVIKARGLGRFDKLIVVATRQMLGALRKEWPNTVKKLLAHELDKDILGQNLTNPQIVAEIIKSLDLISL